VFEGIAPLLLRLYLSPILIQAGWTKFQSFENTALWFGNQEYGLGLPFPEFLAMLATVSELIGGTMLLLGLFTRIVSVPLMITMLVAIFTVHLEHGWLAISDASSWLANGTIFYDEDVIAGIEKKQRILALLQENGHYEWLTSSGPIVILNNGIEFAATYFVMLLVLFFSGGGRFTCLDYYLKKWLTKVSVTR
jgi:uncharacterized membrane protein YphA (DoxX/SURF4 family)